MMQHAECLCRAFHWCFAARLPTAGLPSCLRSPACRAAREAAKAQRARQDLAAKTARLAEYRAQQAREQEARVSAAGRGCL